MQLLAEGTLRPPPGYPIKNISVPMGKLSPSTSARVSVGASMGPSTAKSASRSQPFTGTPWNSEPSGNTTRTVSNGQTTCAFVTTYPPSISTPLPVPVTVSMNAMDGETLSKIWGGSEWPRRGRGFWSRRGCGFWSRRGCGRRSWCRGERDRRRRGRCC